MNEDLKFNNIPSAELDENQSSASEKTEISSCSAPQKQTEPEKMSGIVLEKEPIELSGSDEKAQTEEKEPRTEQTVFQKGSTDAVSAVSPSVSENSENISTPRSANGYNQSTAANNSFAQNAPRQNAFGYGQNSVSNNAHAQHFPQQNVYGYGQNLPYQQGYYVPPQNNRYYPPQGYPAAANVYPPYLYQPGPKELEKLSLAKDSSTAGKTTITILIVMTVVALIIEIIGVFCGVVQDTPSTDDPYVGFTPMGFYMYEGLTSLLSIFIPSLIIIKSSGRKMTELMPFKKIEGKKLFAIVMCGMSLCMVAQIMSTLIGVNFALFGIDIYKGLEMEQATGIFDLIMSVVCTAVIPALVEEFAYRGLVLGILKKHDELLAVFGSAFLFGMLHGNFAQIPFAFVVGLILGYVRVKTDSMLPGILIHFGNNFYAVVVTHFAEVLPEAYGGMVEAGLIAVLIICGFIALSYLLRNEKDFFKLETKPSHLTYGEKVKTFMTTGTVIASIVILSIMSVAVYAVL